MAIVAIRCVAQDASPSLLSKDDRAMLLSLIGDPLTDPTGKQHCTVTIVARTCWGTSSEVDIGAWYQPASETVPARVYFTDNDWIAAPTEFKHRDFVAESEELLAPDEDVQKISALRRRTPNLERVAWLAKLGHEDLAARTFARLKADMTQREVVPTSDELAERLRGQLAWSAYADAVHAYMQRADEESLRHAKRLDSKYPGFADWFGNGYELLAELHRRKESKTFGKIAPEKPIDFDQWEKQKQAHWLIGQLDQVDARQSGQPGGVSIGADWRVEALVAIGEPAVDGLIETFENDPRLTRSVEFQRDFEASRTILSVRETAFYSLKRILRTCVFESSADWESFRSGRGDPFATTVASLRHYWANVRDTPFENRMMEVLTNPESDLESLREAAQNLALLDQPGTLPIPLFSAARSVKSGDTPPNRAIGQFTNPTAAEAILAAMDRELCELDPKNDDDGSTDSALRRIGEIYLDSLVQLGDDRIAAQLRQRCDETKTLSLRLQLVQATRELGDSIPLNAFATEFLNGKIKLPTIDERTKQDRDSERELEEIVRTLGTSNTPPADAALAELSDPKHPYYAIAARGIQRGDSDWTDTSGWFVHPYCIAFLRRELDDKTPTGTTAVIDEQEGGVERFGNRGLSWHRMPDAIAVPASRRPRAELRKCDIAAEKLAALVIGLPVFHPLMNDFDQRLDTMRTVLDMKSGSLRRATDEEREQHDRTWGPVFVIE